MATQSNIIVISTDGKARGIKVHYDGYLEGVGAMLIKHYATQELADALVAGGHASALGARCDGAPGHSFATPVKGQTIYYGRDRGEGNSGPCHGESARDVLYRLGKEEFNYVYDGARWTMNGKDLAEAIKELSA